MPSQSDLRYRFQPLVCRVSFEVVSFTLTEAVSQPFALTLELVSYESDIDFTQLLDRPVLFTICGRQVLPKGQKQHGTHGKKRPVRHNDLFWMNGS